MDNYGRKAVAYLPEIIVEGITDPVIQVIRELDNEIVYTLRITGNTFKPKVFSTGTFTVIVSEPDKGLMKKLSGVSSVGIDSTQTLKISYN